MKKNTWQIVIQMMISVLTAIATTLGICKRLRVYTIVVFSFVRTFAP